MARKVWIFATVFCAYVSFAGQRIPFSQNLFGTEAFGLRINPQNGAIQEIVCDGKAVVQSVSSLQAFDILVGENWTTGDGSGIVAESLQTITDDTLCARLRVGDWRVNAYVQLFPEERMVRRWFELTWQKEEPARVKSFWAQAGWFRMEAGDTYCLPANYPCQRLTRDELTGAVVTAWRDPKSVLAEMRSGWSVMWLVDRAQAYSDNGSTQVYEWKDDKSLRLVTGFSTMGHFRKGETQRLGDAWIWVQRADGETALRNLPQWFGKVGQTIPKGRPEWVSRLILYSLHPGGTIGSNCRDLGGFPAATALLPHIASLGCNATWLMPIEDASIYCPRDYYKLQEGIGTPDDYHAFVGEAHRLGMRVWQDCVPHGGRSEYPRAKQHPEWLAQREDGSTLDYWCFDFNWPTWIDYMEKVASFYTQTYLIDGFRIDAVEGSHIPNWNPKIPYSRASHSQSQGGFAMQRALRRALRSARPDGANLAEVEGGVFSTTSDAIYDFSICYEILPHWYAEGPENFVPRLRRWLQDQLAIDIPGTLRMRHIESHDSLRASLRYGHAATEAAMALIAWIDGFPLVYQEMEDGHFYAYQKIFATRRTVEELNTGKADYLSVEAPPPIFACLRSGKAASSAVFINFSGAPVKELVRVPAWGEKGTAKDVLSGNAYTFINGRFLLELPPFGYAVVRHAPDNERVIASVRSLLSDTTVKETKTVAVPPVGTQQLLVKSGVRENQNLRWFADTAEGHFEGPFRVRHPGSANPSANQRQQVSYIYLRPQGGSEFFDSRMHPFGLTEETARFGIVENGKATVYTGFKPGTFVQFLDTVDGVTGIHLKVQPFVPAFSADKESPLPTADPACRDWLTAIGGGWRFDNGKIRVDLRRNGAIFGFWKNEGGRWRKAMDSLSAYTDNGFGKGRLCYEQKHDAEPYIQILPLSNKRLRLVFSGSLRGKERFDRLPHPIDFHTTYTLGEGEEVDAAYAFQPRKIPTANYGYFAIRIHFPEATGATLTDASNTVRQFARTDTERYGATKEWAEKLPRRIAVNRKDGTAFELGNLFPIVNAPSNVFLLANQLHFSWEGKPSSVMKQDEWFGVSLRFRP